MREVSNEKELRSQIKDINKHVLIFYIPGCPPCMNLVAFTRKFYSDKNIFLIDRYSTEFEKRVDALNNNSGYPYVQYVNDGNKSNTIGFSEETIQKLKTFLA